MFDIVNPYNGDIVGKAVDASNSDIQGALEKSYDYQCELSATERANILLKTANYFEKHILELAKLITLETGLCLKDTKYEIGRVVNCARYSAKVCHLVERDTTANYLLDEENKPKLNVINEPMDLIVGITPFNHPMNQVAHKVFPSIASGASMVLKPSEKTPLSAIKLVEILIEHGLPDNMVNVITGKDANLTVKNILLFSDMDMLTFTGGLSAGLIIQKEMIKHGHALKRYVPELGGCSSLIICSDADLDLAVKIIMNGCFKNSGQRCTSIRRVIIEQKVAEEFIDKLMTQVASISYGNPNDEQTDMGTVINEESAKKIENRINLAITKGAKLLYGGKRQGALLSPTVLDHVDVSMELVAMETFGPVCPIIRATDYSEALLFAKQTNYRLAGAIITADKNKAMTASKELKVGQFSINGPPSYRTEAAPFGGFGDSGNGEKEGVILAAHGMRRIRTTYEH
ncbi:MAG: aldehyde dehydrogenase family protein [Proteobacteria bacterium]|nr:aldehyde dehydrogenase family protein [Pseudomonadota bacterium]